MNEESLDHLRDQILEYLDGRLDDQGLEKLQESLAADQEARREFVKLAHLDAGLRDAVLNESPRTTAVPRIKLLALWGGSLAAIAVLLLAGLNWLGKDSGKYTAAPGSYGAIGVAVISAQGDAVWGPHSPNLKKGEAIAPGRLVLESGLVQIDFFGGASISLSGPAVLELVSEKEAVLHQGSLKADVPPAARGFKIRSGNVMIEDLGTSFGLAVRENSSADLVVFDGEVMAFGKDGKSMSLLSGQSAHLSNGQATIQSVNETRQFPDIESVFEGVVDQDQIRYASWKEASTDLRKDPRLIAYYDFENLTSISRRLRNRAISGGGAELDGGIVGARVAHGRWPQKTSLDFRQEGDRVRFMIPGEFNGLTIFAWVRIDALDRGLNSLFLTDYYDPREFHWQLSNKGALHFATSPRGVENLERNNRRFYSEPFWNPGKSGQWFFLATTVDRSSGVTHFIDGNAVAFSGGTNMEKPLPVMRIGKADLGNWSEPIWPNASIRTLNGRIDEFALFREALGSDEIRRIYDSGRP